MVRGPISKQESSEYSIIYCIAFYVKYFYGISTFFDKLCSQFHSLLNSGMIVLIPQNYREESPGWLLVVSCWLLAEGHHLILVDFREIIPKCQGFRVFVELYFPNERESLIVLGSIDNRRSAYNFFGKRFTFAFKRCGAQCFYKLF